MHISGNNPGLIYPALVWWERTNLATTRTTLEKLSELILRSITWVMKMAPIAELETERSKSWTRVIKTARKRHSEKKGGRHKLTTDDTISDKTTICLHQEMTDRKTHRHTRTRLVVSF